MADRLHPDEVAVDEALVARLVGRQHPQWAPLPVRRVTSTGTDHAVFRLGAHLAVRLPRIGWAEQQVEREARWLSHLSPHLPVAVAEPVATGEPDLGYPFRWLLSTWVPGRDLLDATAEGLAPSADLLADAMAEVVAALHRAPAGGGPPARKRGRALAPHDDMVRAGIDALAHELDATAATRVWEQALAAEAWPREPVWVHGDLLPGNVIVEGTTVVAVIDWSATGLGDPACDAMIAWSLPPAARSRFRQRLAIDGDTWARAKGWVIEQSVAFIPYYERTLPAAVAAARQRMRAVLTP